MGVFLWVRYPGTPAAFWADQGGLVLIFTEKEFFIDDQVVRIHLTTDIILQGLLESKDTHRPMALRQG